MDPFLVHRGKLSNLATHRTLIISHTRLVQEVNLRKRKKGRTKGQLEIIVEESRLYRRRNPSGNGFIPGYFRPSSLLLIFYVKTYSPIFPDPTLRIEHLSASLTGVK